MARSVFFLLCVLFVQSAWAAVKTDLLVTTLQDPQILSSREEIDRLIGFSRLSNIDTLHIQIYRADKAWFPSKLADDTPYKQFSKDIGEDPFALLIRKAHRSGIKVFAWLNLLSLSKNAQAPILQKYGVDILTRNQEPKNSLGDYLIDNQYFLEPGDLRVREELSGIVKEILRVYPDLDGILFDYIRYPDVHPFYGYTEMNMRRFKKETGVKTIEENQLWKNWKRDQVTDLLKGLVESARKIRPDITLATTGCVSHSRAYNEAFQDWPLWINTGLTDFVMVMAYPKDAEEYQKYISEAKTRTDDLRKLHFAVAAYKLTGSPEEFTRHLRVCKSSGAAACVIFHYGSLLDAPAMTKTLTEF